MRCKEEPMPELRWHEMQRRTHARASITSSPVTNTHTDYQNHSYSQRIPNMRVLKLIHHTKCCCTWDPPNRIAAKGKKNLTRPTILARQRAKKRGPRFKAEPAGPRDISIPSGTHLLSLDCRRGGGRRISSARESWLPLSPSSHRQACKPSDIRRRS